MTPVDTAAAQVIARATRFSTAIDDYRAFRVGIAAVRTAGNAVKRAMYQLESMPGDVDDVDAYLSALRHGRGCAKGCSRLVALHVAGTPDR